MGPSEVYPVAKQTDTNGRFIAEFELRVNPHQAAVIRKRLEAGRLIYNALLREGLKRLNLFRQSRLYQRALRIPGRTEEQKQARRAAFKAAREAFGWSEVGLTAHLQRFGQQFTRSWLNEHVNSQIVKKLAERAARVVHDHSLGRKGRPRFKKRGELIALEAINNLQGIIVKARDDGSLYVDWGAGRGAEHLHLPLIVDPDDPYHRHALATMQPEAGFPGLKFTRIVRKVIRGKDRFYAQLVLVGRPYQRDRIQRHGVVGLDIGPSTLAIVAEALVDDPLAAGKEGPFRRFCDELADKEKAIRRLQRRLDRQLRANNPDCFDEQGRWIKGRRARNVSNRMRRTLAKLRTIRRQQAEHRKSLHGHLVRQLLALGSEIRLEKLRYKSFQRAFGRSVLSRAPGMFVAHLKRKASEIGVVMTELPTHRTRLSQTCHCGRIRKKSLSERIHRCECGIRAHRDLYSAYLARYVDGDQVDLARAAADWPRFQALVSA